MSFEITNSQETEQTENDRNRQQLEKLEKTILTRLEDFYQIGKALAAILDKKLYVLSGINDFDEYCQVRFEKEFSTARVYQLIEAANVYDQLSQKVKPEELPKREAHIRPLTRKSFSEEQRQKIWEDAVKAAGKDRLQTEHVVKAIESLATTGNGQKSGGKTSNTTATSGMQMILPYSLLPEDWSGDRPNANQSHVIVDTTDATLKAASRTITKAAANGDEQSMMSARKVKDLAKYVWNPVSRSVKTNSDALFVNDPESVNGAVFVPERLHHVAQHPEGQDGADESQSEIVFVSPGIDLLDTWVPSIVLMSILETAGKASKLKFLLLTRHADKLAEYVERFLLPENVLYGIVVSTAEEMEEAQVWAGLLKGARPWRYVMDAAVLEALPSKTPFRWVVVGSEVTSVTLLAFDHLFAARRESKCQVLFRKALRVEAKEMPVDSTIVE